MSTRLLSSLLLLLLTLGWGDRSSGAQVSVPHGELRIVDKRLTNRFSIQNHAIEGLVGIDYQEGTLVPRLASGWRWRDDRTLEVTLRQGVTFHNGEVLEAEHVRLSWEACNGFRAFYGPDLAWWTFPPETRLEILAPHLLQLVLPAPDAAALLKLLRMPIANRQFFRFQDQRVQRGEVQRGNFFRTLRMPGPWGTGPYQVVAGAFQFRRPADQTVLEAHRAYWDKARVPQVQRLVFDHTMAPQEAQERVMTTEGQVDLFVATRPLDTLQVAHSPFAKVVKERSALTTVFGLFNMRKADSPWHDLRLRQAVNAAINREDVLRDAAQGHGVLVPALLPPGAVGFDATLPPYPFDPTAARRLVREAGYPEGLPLTLLAPTDLEVQASVVSKMLEPVGLTVQQQVLEPVAFTQATNRYWLVPSRAEQQPTPRPTWDIALISGLNPEVVISPFAAYTTFLFDGAWNWIDESPALRELLAQLLPTGERASQQAVAAQMERHIRDQALFLFLYAPMHFYAVNKEVTFVPHPSGMLLLEATGVTAQHWSVRQQKTTAPQ